MVTVLLLSAIIPPLVVFSFGGGRDVLTSRDDFPDSVGTRPDVVSRDDADRLQTIGESGDFGNNIPRCSVPVLDRGAIGAAS